MIYNDSYSVFAGGRHPYLLGTPVELGWLEVAEFNRHVVDTCLAGGTLAFNNKELVRLAPSGRFGGMAINSLRDTLGIALCAVVAIALNLLLPGNDGRKIKKPDEPLI